MHYALFDGRLSNEQGAEESNLSRRTAQVAKALEIPAPPIDKLAINRCRGIIDSSSGGRPQDVTGSLQQKIRRWPASSF